MVGGGGGDGRKLRHRLTLKDGGGWWGVVGGGQLRKYKYNEFVRVENINNGVRIRTRG